ncbi:MAG: hypothetical protein QF827_13715 [Alphaproteobacteria bacterium]|jgi:hypothetical protein|nr:hypothetical protein [Alphaproteobacteria bacterium]
MTPVDTVGTQVPLLIGPGAEAGVAGPRNDVARDSGRAVVDPSSTTAERNTPARPRAEIAARAPTAGPRRPAEPAPKIRDRRAGAAAGNDLGGSSDGGRLEDFLGSGSSAGAGTLVLVQQIAQEVLLLDARPRAVDVAAADAAFRRADSDDRGAPGLQRRIDVTV